MDDSMSTRRIYTTLDSLFDTELAYLDLIDPRLSREYFTDEYSIEDSYLYLSYSSFREMFKNRDKRVLGYSKATSVPDLIRGIINDMDIKRKTGETVNSKITLTINTYPYKLDMDEEKEIILDSRKGKEIAVFEATEYVRQWYAKEKAEFEK